jgi:hypothetical protein
MMSPNEELYCLIRRHRPAEQDDCDITKRQTERSSAFAASQVTHGTLIPDSSPTGC